MKNLLDTKTASLQEILGNGKIYKIPTFQRDYSWKEENWDDLWQDFLFLEENENPHYMGTIVLQTQEENDDLFLVVDGQQRLTTLSIVIISIIKVLKDLVEKGIEVENNEQRIEKIQNMFIGEKSLSDLHYKSKITLNKNNNLFFQDRILIFKEPVNYHKLRDSEKLLFDAYKYFYSKIREKFKNDDGAQLGLFLEKYLAKKLIFIQITVDDDLSAYTVFETLNARGVDLTTTDLLKNYLFSIASNGSSEINILEERWKNIVDSVGLKTFPTFLRYYLNAKQNLVRKEQLFKNIKKNITSAEDVFDLLDVLEGKANLFNALKNPEDDFWNEYSDKIKIQKYLRELKLFGVSQFIPLLFSVHEKLPDIFADILRVITVVSFRYNIIGRKNPNNMERVYNEVAQKIFKKNIVKKSEIIESLKSIYISDEDFRNIFKTKELTTGGRNKKLVKYILTKIENHISNSDHDFNDANFTIEHILPENFPKIWDEEFENNANKFVYRIGNYTLLEDKKNKLCGTQIFMDKKEIYESSRYKLTKDFLSYSEWNISNLNSFQDKLAKQAISIWSL